MAHGSTLGTFLFKTFSADSSFTDGTTLYAVSSNIDD